MDFKLIWSESSIEDLGAIVRFVALRDGADIARRIGFGIYDRAQEQHRWGASDAVDDKPRAALEEPAARG